MVAPGNDELDLHRMAVDEAIPKLEEFLYSSFQSRLRRIWVIHGKGTGILRREVRRYLSKHPLVESFWPAQSDRGGAGATAVLLSER